jgi:hypothetical protein
MLGSAGIGGAWSAGFVPLHILRVAEVESGLDDLPQIAMADDNTLVT